MVTRTGPKGRNGEIEEDEDNDEIEFVVENQTKESEEDEIIAEEVEKETTKKKSEKVEKKCQGKDDEQSLEQMPKYAKFMKNILTKKKRYTDEETILLDARCSVVIQKTTPRKEFDPGRVTLPVTIGRNYTGNSLIDLESSINLIPLSIVKRLGNIVMKPTRMTLQLADKSINLPYEVAQDMLVKVDKFLFLVDFVVVDMEEDRDPLIALKLHLEVQL
ncbi:uncharacterized protein LOC131629191 [Vicia villosa]|uniref:uncharacterized protein LOC131629191 n=1 Tax=Vicia villosa TaxID=3911 RepID=UPI00273B9DD2|nr:uncharacterized protein LOC131629191 [Vicia villosa]